MKKVGWLWIRTINQQVIRFLFVFPWGLKGQVRRGHKVQSNNQLPEGAKVYREEGKYRIKSRCIRNEKSSQLNLSSDVNLYSFSFYYLIKRRFYAKQDDMPFFTFQHSYALFSLSEVERRKWPILLIQYINLLYMDQKYDLLHIAKDKSVVKEFNNAQIIFMSCPIFKFNDYKKKQERNLLITNMAVYNLKGNEIKRKIQINKIKGVSYSRIGTQFIIHIPSQYDYRYASSDLRDKIIYCILKSYCKITGQKLPIYYRDELSLNLYAMTKEDKKKIGSKDIKGNYTLHNDQSYKQYLQGEQQQKQVVRKTTKTLFAKNFQEEITINDFTPKVVLGKGAFGTVLLVQKKGTKELFAMKSISKEDIIKKDQIEHTKTEKIILQHVNHPFLVNLVYAFQTPQKLYFIMQFMKGGELFQHLANSKKFSEKQSKFYSMQIALALGHLHNKDFIYRDLKLQNVLMDENGNVCLTDFGMAKIIRDGQLAQTFCGTPEYIAPEVLQGRGYDKSADWWSLGILTYEMIYGLPPFYHNSQKQMFKKIKQNEIKFSEKVKVSEQGKDFILKMLNRDPKTRLGSKGQALQVLSHPWFQQFDKQKMMRKELKPPFKPKVEGDGWLDGFDKEFTSEKAVYDDKGQKSQTNHTEYEKLFKNF